MQLERKYAWESYGEYVALQQFSRCLGAVLASAPKKLARRASRPLIRTATRTSVMFSVAHAEEPPDPRNARLPHDVRVQARQLALDGADVLRQLLMTLEGQVSAPHYTAALELLERFEQGVRERPLPAPRSD